MTDGTLFFMTLLRVVDKRFSAGIMCLILLSLGILALASSFAPAHAQVIILNVTEVDAPTQVGVGDTFTVKVTIDYSFSGAATVHVGIWDEDLNQYASGDSSSGSWTKLDVQGSGTRLVTIQVIAPQDTKTWHLSAYALYYGNDGKYHAANENTYVKYFTVQVTPGTFQLNIVVDPAEAERYITITGTGPYPKGESVKVTFDDQVAGSTGTRYLFVTYIIDGVQTPGNPATLIMDSDHNVVAQYKTQYYLTVKSDYGSASGTGWYDKGSTATAKMDVTSVSAGIPYVNRFTHWSGDATGSGATSDPITMDGPKTATAVWEKQFGCLIATATYGSELSPEVTFLRGFRDNAILNTNAGNEFMKVFNSFYYSFSPGVASFIGTHEYARTAMKVVLYPLLGILYVSAFTYQVLSLSPELAVISAGLVAGTLIGIVYFTPVAFALIVALRRFRKFHLRTRHLRLVAVMVATSALLIAVAETFGYAQVMQFATVAFVLASLSFSSGYVAIKLAGKVINRKQLRFH